ncbi:MAG: PaaI family thioesterase [Streptococcaceae bacterium]|nr:PaaI family thioesterase [Streptococcaceae bacterium]MCL2681037.1 PaaI family thioesterase [Streptococcaceae bacterium]MCL2858331.1 PaaI family thioesterase [Streptococcaceae bacterium]
MTLIEQLNIKNLTLTDTGFTAQMELNEFHAQHLGYLTGGASLAFGETTAGMASNMLLDDEHTALGQSVSGNHLSPTGIDNVTLEGRGTLLHKGRTSHVWDIQLATKDGRLISHITVTNAIIQKP